MPRRTLTLAAAACVLVLLVAAQALGRPARPTLTCSTNPDTSLHWEAVFGHATSTWQATLLAAPIQHSGFQGIQLERDSCWDVELSVPGIDSAADRTALALEASQVGVDVSFEPPDIQKAPDSINPKVKAVFGTLPTLARASKLQLQMAHYGFREGSDIEGLALHSWRVVVDNVPADAQTGFAAEAASVGFQVTFLPQ